MLLILPHIITDHKTWVGQYLLEQKITRNPENDISLSWINSDSKPLSIIQVRQMISDLQFFVPTGQVRYVIVLQIDQASEEAQNALLKTLEEEIESTQFIITACDKSQVLPTVLSRCTVKNVRLSYQQDSDNSLSTGTDTKINSYTQAIKMAEELTDRAIAYDQLQNWLYSLVEKSTAKHLNQIKIIRQALLNLKQNGNVRLILENCFFQLKTATSK